ncbi:immunity repressor protein [Planococcus donghaensis MPA1U2]|uniref:Immunity repressor protein n=1 Tax=Planococcus donghaensis MPA1U2 TaxID=933115 RepID=E7RCM7_9BACL|nr:helix-turn-helix transcriptional regulator [Planococcus donghaensis]EGA91392.1 immunity repressor protein [Planococcus donghaensis MPA1U2]
MLSKRLKLVRQKRKMTQEELARTLGTTKGSISNYENGRSSPSVEVLVNIANILNSSTDYLLGRTLESSDFLREKLKDAQENNTHFIEVSGLNQEDIEFLKNQIEFLRKKNLNKN